MAAETQAPAPARSAQPVMEIAARGKKKEPEVVEVPPPKWRLIAADLGAGATAGASVEAGECDAPSCVAVICPACNTMCLAMPDSDGAVRGC